MPRASMSLRLGLGSVVLIASSLSAVVLATPPGPEITGISPDPVEPGATARPVTVSGSRFLERLTLTVTGPNGGSAAYREPVIRELRDSSFVVPVLFPTPGDYQFVVTNADGGASNLFRVTAKANSAAPVISEVRPAHLRASSSQQALTLLGRGFVPGIAVSVTDPAGGVQDVPAGAIADVRPASVDITVTLELAGDYTVVVTTPAGTPSNALSFRVGPR
jgi:hypothetical protein